MTVPDPTRGCALWPLVPECLPEGWDPDPASWTSLQRRSVGASASILRRASGNVFNLCPQIVRPCGRGVAGYRYLNDPLQSWSPVMLDGRFSDLVCGGGSACGCGALSEVILDPAVHSIIEVKVDGVAVPYTAYRVDDWRRLVRVDGARWPSCQDVARADTEPGTFSVAYWSGSEPDDGAAFALTELSVEWWRGCEDKACRLGPNVRTATRAGVTVDFDQVLQAIERGGTGLKRVDMWIRSVNPYGLRRRMAVFSPDVAVARRTTEPTRTFPPAPSPAPPREAFRYVQNAPIALWTIVHNLGFYPAGIRIEDSAGQEASAEVSYPDISTVRLEFSEPMAGVAYLS